MIKGKIKFEIIEIEDFKQFKQAVEEINRMVEEINRYAMVEVSISNKWGWFK